MSVSNITNGIKQVAFATHQSVKLDENISTLFGAKFLSSLIEFSFTIDDSNVKLATASYGAGQIREDDKIEETYHIDEVRTEEENLGELLVDHNVTSSEFNASVRGFISKVGVGVGRSDNDRQFVFCNGRPVDMPKVTKTLNEVWRKYEMKNKPAFIIDLKVSAGNFDVNLAPDKREVVIRHEFVIIDKLKEVVDQLYSPSRHTFSIGKPVPISSFLVSAVDKDESFKNATNHSDGPFVASTTVNDEPVLGEIIHTVGMPEMNNNAMLKYPKELSICSSNAPHSSPSLRIDKIKGDVIWISPLEKERFDLVNDSETCDLQPVGMPSESYSSDSATMNEVDKNKVDDPCDHFRDEVTNSSGISEVVDGQQILWKNKINTIKMSDSYFIGRKRKLELLHGISDNIANIDRMDSSKSAEFDHMGKFETFDSKFDAEHFKTLSKSVSSSFIFPLIILYFESFFSRILVE